MRVKKTASKNAAAKKNNKEPVTYMGPDIRHVAMHGTTYSNGIPANLKEKIAEIPALKGLLVPVSKLAASSVAISTKGSALNNLYHTAADRLAGNGKSGE